MTLTGSITSPRVVRSMIVASSLRPGVSHQHFEEEAVQLGLGQRIGAFLLDGVLRGHYQERHFELIAFAGRRDGAFLHGFEHGRLGFGRGAVDFVGQADLGEDRPALELEEPLAFDGFHDHVGAEDVGGHKIGGELYAVEIQVEGFCQRADQERLAQAGHAFEQAMAAGEQARQYAVNDFVVADDYPVNLLADRRVAIDELAGTLFHFFCNAHGKSVVRG